MKVGRFVYVVRDEPSESLILCNLLNQAVIEAVGDERDAVEAVLAAPADEPADEWSAEVAQMMRAQGFVVPDDADELAPLKGSVTADSGRKAFAIVLTPKCNFRCSYCYQEHSGESFRHEDEGRLLALIDRILPQTSHLALTWWGGEPLLRLDTIEDLSRKIISKCDAAKVGYSAYTATNGALLTRQVAQRLKEARLERFQITVDGPRSDHDRHRLSADGSGTYDAVLAGLAAIAETYGTVERRIVLRINLSAQSRAGRGEWVELFDYLRPYRDMIRINISPVAPSFRFEATLDTDAFARPLAPLLAMAHLEGFVTSGPLASTPGTGGCTAFLDDSWIVLPGGRLTRCTMNFESMDADWGRITEDGEIEHFSSAASAKWTLPLERDDCLACSVLPACMGGCPVAEETGDVIERCAAKRLVAAHLLARPNRRTGLHTMISRYWERESNHAHV